MNEEDDAPKLYTKTDYDFVLKMRKTINPTGADQDRILELYRKYIQWIWGYTTNCNCSTGIGTLWNTLNDWVIKNDSLFEH